MVNSDVVSNYALNEWHDRAAHDRHIQNTGTISGQRPEFGYSKTEDAGEHDGVEESDCQNAPHGDVGSATHVLFASLSRLSYRVSKLIVGLSVIELRLQQ